MMIARVKMAEIVKTSTLKNTVVSASWALRDPIVNVLSVRVSPLFDIPACVVKYLHV